VKTLLGSMLLLWSLTTNADFYDPLEYEVFGDPATSEDKAAIDNVMEKNWLAWSSHDAIEIATTYTQDAEWTNSFGRSFRGVDAITEFLQNNLFPAFSKMVSETETQSYVPVSRRYIGDDAAVLTGRLESNRGSSEHSGNRIISLTFVLEKRNNQWKISNQIIADLRERR